MSSRCGRGCYMNLSPFRPERRMTTLKTWSQDVLFLSLYLVLDQWQSSKIQRIITNYLQWNGMKKYQYIQHSEIKSCFTVCLLHFIYVYRSLYMYLCTSWHHQIIFYCGSPRVWMPLLWTIEAPGVKLFPTIGRFQRFEDGLGGAS